METDLQKIQEFLSQIVEFDIEIEPTTDLISLGLDSIGLIKFLLLLENGFEIEIEDDDLFLQDWDTPEKILHMIEKYRQES